MEEWRRKQAWHDECGMPYEVCGDPQRSFAAYRVVDYAAMVKAGAEAQYAALHDKFPYHDGTFGSWAKDRSASHPYHYFDGVHIGVAEKDLFPWDLFTTATNASPIKPEDSDT